MSKKLKYFVVLVGNIGAGKSTLAKSLVGKGFIVCCRDALRYMIGAGNYRFDPNIEPALADAHDNMLEGFLSNDLNVIVDEVNVQSTRRYHLDLIAQHYENYVSIAIVLPKLSMAESVKRRLKNEHGKFGKKVWEGVWNRFNKLYSDPSEKEGFNYVFFMKENTPKEVNMLCKTILSIKKQNEKNNLH
jgi:predicted kinase